MTMTIGQDKETGTFNYEVHNGFDLIEAGAGYPTFKEAEAAATVCYHMLHDVNFVWTEPFFQNYYMSTDDIFNELDMAL